MAGFGSVTLVGEYYGQAIVNKLWYRAAAWLPLQGNPFDDVLAFVDAVWANIQQEYKDALSTNLTILRAEGVGYDDNFQIVTASPLVRTINATGTIAGDTTGAIICGNIMLRCGPQVQIGGVGQSRRNRGYIAVGPLTEAQCDNYGHLGAGATATLNALAAKLDNSLTIVAPAVTLIPIRIHERWFGAPPFRVNVFRTYSDVMGYSVSRKFGTRKSRHTEA